MAVAEAAGTACIRFCCVSARVGGETEAAGVTVSVAAGAARDGGCQSSSWQLLPEQHDSVSLGGVGDQLLPAQGVIVVAGAFLSICSARVRLPASCRWSSTRWRLPEQLVSVATGAARISVPRRSWGSVAAGAVRDSCCRSISVHLQREGEVARAVRISYCWRSARQRLLEDLVQLQC